MPPKVKGYTFKRTRWKGSWGALWKTHFQSGEEKYVMCPKDPKCRHMLFFFEPRRRKGPFYVIEQGTWCPCVGHDKYWLAYPV